MITPSAWRSAIAEFRLGPRWRKERGERHGVASGGEGGVLRVCNVDEEGRFGGPERRIVQLAHAMRPHGIETTVVYPMLDSDAFAAHIAKHGVQAIELDITRLSLQKRILIRYAVRFPLEVAMLVRLLRRERFDLVHVNGAYQFKVAIAARLAATPAVWHLNDTHGPKSLKAAFQLVARACAGGFIVAGQRVREYYLAGTMLDELPCQEVHAPVNLDVFDPNRFGSASPEAQGADGQRKLRIGTVSGVNPVKGLEYFVEMAAALLATNPEIEFSVAGATLKSQKAYHEFILQRMAALGLKPGQIRFVGLVEDVPAFLSKLDICVFTSVSEASPTSVWEAMAMAKPLVTTDAGSVRQHVEDGVTGFVVPVRDVRQLVSRVQQLVRDEELRAAVGEAARLAAAEHLSIESAAASTSQFYRRTCTSTLRVEPANA